MIVVVCGMPRSASTWSYNACREICLRTGRQVDPASGAYSSEEMAAKACEGVAPDTVRLLRSHWPLPATIDLLRERQIRAVYTVRDPRDATASAVCTFGNSFKSAARQTERSLSLMDALTAVGGALVLRYADITASAARVIMEVANYLGMPITEDDARAIAEKLSRENLRKQADASDVEKLKTFEGFLYDPDTLLLKDHIRLEQPADWHENLSESQGRFLSWYWRKRLVLLDAMPTSSEMGSCIFWPERLYYLARLRMWEFRY